MKKTFRIIIGVLISGFSLWYVLKGFHWSDLRNSLDSANWNWIVPGTVAILFAFCGRTFRWQILLKPITHIPFGKLFFILSFGYLANNVLPARGGEFARAYAASHYSKKSFSSIFGTVFTERLTDLLSYVLMMIIASSMIPKDFLPIGKMVKIIAVVMIVGLFFIGFSMFINKKKKIKRPKIVEKIINFLRDFSHSWSSLKSPKTTLLVFSVTLFIWTMDVASVIFLSKVFGLNLSPMQGLTLIVGIVVGVMIPAAPGYIGTFELFGSRILILMGIASSTATGFVLLLHAFQLIFTSLLGIPYLIQMGFFPSANTQKIPNEATS